MDRAGAAQNILTGAVDETRLLPIFVHSSFRTGSTWLWSKFRHNPRFYAYYEFYNEALASLDLATIAHSARDWPSRHPVEAPYFLEFAPLLREQGGVRGYDPAMAFAEFFPAAHAREGDCFAAQRDYVGLLIDTARKLGRIPVLTCTRSLARVDRLKQMFGGLHLGLRRNLLHQWFSYSNQALNGNPYFIGTIVDTVFADTDDRVMAVLRRFMRDNRMQPADAAALLPDDNMFICFAVLHIYLDFLGERDADAVIDLGDLASDGSRSACASLAAIVREHSGANIEFADAREVVSAPMMLFADPGRIDLTVRSIFLMLRQTAAAASDAFEDLADSAGGRMERLWTEYDRYCHFSGSAHREIARLKQAPRPEPSETASPIAQQQEALAANLREATDYAESLLASRNDILAERETLRAELAVAASRGDALDAVRERLAGERDEAVQRLANAATTMQQDREASKAALDDASTYAASLRADYDAVVADRDAVREELAATMVRADALDAACVGLDRERDVFLRRLAEAEAGVQQVRGALKAASDETSRLRASRDEIAADRDAARRELAEAVGRGDMFDAARARLEAERDAALRRLAEAEAIMRRDHDAHTAELEAAGAQIATATAERDAAELRIAALTAETAALASERECLAASLIEAVRDTERQSRDAASAREARARLAEQHAAAMAAAQHRVAALEQLLDARVFDDPGEADIFARRWANMIAMLK